MTKFLLVLHVLVAIIAVGPVSVAASMFPPSARRALADPADPRAAETVRLLHRICRVYAAIGIAVPVFGFATGLSMGVLNSGWLIASMALTGIAAAVLLALVLPRQEEILEAVEARTGTGTETGTGTGTGTKSESGAAGAAGAEGGVTSRAATTATSASASASMPDEITANPRLTVQLAMFTGVFNLLWATVTILMIVRPGSTTGA
ncbi:protease [Streptomyces aurantiacus]|uniref:protease n=1 Tax=Streptomyces aurantiacus TaxID=47760 RepID=UPI0027D8F999|nr:protease [Streptomyces aurantiacus]